MPDTQTPPAVPKPTEQPAVKSTPTRTVAVVQAELDNARANHLAGQPRLEKELAALKRNS